MKGTEWELYQEGLRVDPKDGSREWAGGTASTVPARRGGRLPTRAGKAQV